MSIISGFPISCSDQIDVIRLFTDIKNTGDSPNLGPAVEQTIRPANQPERLPGAEWPPKLGQ